MTGVPVWGPSERDTSGTKVSCSTVFWPRGERAREPRPVDERLSKG